MSISLNARLLSGEQCNLELDSSSTVAQLQERLISNGFLSRELGYRFIFSGRQLAADTTLLGAGVSKGNTIHIVPSSSNSAIRSAMEPSTPLVVPSAPLAVENLLQDNSVILLESFCSGKNLRIRKNGEIDANGRKGIWARFVVQQVSPASDDSPQKVNLLNVGTKKFLRLTRDALTVCEAPFEEGCLFSIIPVMDKITLRVEKFGVGVLKDGKIKSPSRTRMGKHAHFYVRVAPSSNPASVLSNPASVPVAKNYVQLFKDNSIVHLTSQVTGKNLRVCKGAFDANGGFGVWTRFKVIQLAAASSNSPQLIRLQNVGSSLFLRLTPEGITAIANPDDACNFKAVSKHINNATISLRGTKCAIGILPDGKIKDPSRTGMGKASQFNIVDVASVPTPTPAQPKAQIQVPFLKRFNLIKLAEQKKESASIPIPSSVPAGSRIVKVYYNGEIRRFETSKFNLVELKSKISNIFNIDGEFSLKYPDDEGDLITFTLDSELDHALQFFKDNSPFRVHVFRK